MEWVYYVFGCDIVVWGEFFVWFDFECVGFVVWWDCLGFGDLVGDFWNIFDVVGD